MGAMVDGAVEGEDGDGDGALHTLSGSRKRTPYLVHQKCRGKPWPPKGPRAPWWFSREDVALHKEQKNMGQRDNDHTSDFT